MPKKIIEYCQWFMKCSHPLYDGECRKDCFDRYYNTLKSREWNQWGTSQKIYGVYAEAKI